jgi:serine/threonine-protein kinase RsbW
MQAEQSRCETPKEAPMRYRQRFAAEPTAVRAALRGAVARFARQIGHADAGALELTLAEVLNNIVEHAYAGEDGSISLSIEAGGPALRCEVVDQGRAMPGLSPPPGHSPDSLAAQRDLLGEGGWGWHLIRSLTQDLDYVRIGAENRLSFRIDLTEEDTADRLRS